MAGPPNQDAGAGPLQTPIPPSPYTVSPITPTGTRPRLNPRRQSRFTEEAMSERTPAASVSEVSFDHWYGPSTENINATTTHNNDNAHNDDNNNTVFGSAPAPDHTTPPELSGRKWGTWTRFINGGLHALPCLVLLGILGYALRVLRQDMASHMSIQAIILIFFLFTDVILDIIVLFTVQKPWATWGLVLRFGCGITYITHFLLYVGLGGVFPEGYTYWGLTTSSAELVVYILLCVEGIWNLLHVPVCRYHLGSTLWGCITSEKSRRSIAEKRTSFNRRVSMVGTERSSISLTWRRWVRTQSSTQFSRDDLENLRGSGIREPSADMTLRERPSEEEEEEETRGSRNGECKSEEKGADKWQEGGLEAKGPRRESADMKT